MKYASLWIIGACKVFLVRLNGTSTPYIQENFSVLRKKTVDGTSTKTKITNNGYIWTYIFLVALFILGWFIIKKPLLINQGKYVGWSKAQLQISLTSCGDIESNPGPGTRARQRRRGGFIQEVKDLVFYKANIRCWRTQKIEIIRKLGELKPDVAIFQETLLSPKTTLVKINGYRVHRKDRTISQRGEESLPIGGGLITLIRDSADFEIDETDIRLTDTVFGDVTTEITEVLLSKIFWRDRKLLITNFYTPLYEQL